MLPGRDERLDGAALLEQQAGRARRSRQRQNVEHVADRARIASRDAELVAAAHADQEIPAPLERERAARHQARRTSRSTRKSDGPSRRCASAAGPAAARSRSSRSRAAGSRTRPIRARAAACARADPTRVGDRPRCLRTGASRVLEIARVELADPVVVQAREIANRPRSSLVLDHPHGEIELGLFAPISVVGRSHVPLSSRFDHKRDFILQKPLVDIYDHIWQKHPEKGPTPDAERRHARPTPAGPRAQPGLLGPGPIRARDGAVMLRAAGHAATRGCGWPVRRSLEGAACFPRALFHADVGATVRQRRSSAPTSTRPSTTSVSPSCLPRATRADTARIRRACSSASRRSDIERLRGSPLTLTPATRLRTRRAALRVPRAALVLAGAAHRHATRASSPAHVDGAATRHRAGLAAAPAAARKRLNARARLPRRASAPLQ